MFESDASYETLFPRTEWVTISSKGLDLQKIKAVLIALHKLQKKRLNRKKKLLADRNEKEKALLQTFKELLGYNYGAEHREVCFKCSLTKNKLKEFKIRLPGHRKRTIDEL